MSNLLINPENVNALAFGIAFLAGLLSFLSPCVLPLVPAYIGYLSGASISGGQVVADSRRTFSHAVAFVLGFSLLFVVLGAFLGLAQWAVKLVSGGDASGAFVGERIVKDLLLNVGVVLLGIMAVRVADNPMDGDWRIRLGGVAVDWPAQMAGVAQKYVRWLLVGIFAGLVFWWLSEYQGLVADRVMKALMITLLPLAGANLSARGALALGVAVSILNSLSWKLSALAPILSPPEWVGVGVQALLIVLVVYYFSRTSLFYMEKRFEVSERLQNRGYLTSGIMGAVFGAGWTPCTGPNLAVILAMAATADKVALGAVLLVMYSLGLGLPFLLVGLMFGAASRGLRRLMPYMGVIKTVNMVLLLLIAVIIFSGSLQALAGKANFFNIGL